MKSGLPKHIFLLAAALWLSSAAAFCGEQSGRAIVKVRATGQAPIALINAREAAIEDALRRCVEAGGGVELASVSKTEDSVLVADAIYARTAGFIEHYDVLAENPNQDGLFTVRVEAIVTRGDINANVEAFKALIKRKGRPRVMVVGKVDGSPFETMVSAKLQSVLEHHGIDVVDAERLTAEQANEAERADRGDLDPRAAALITKQIGADVLAVVSVEGESLPAENVYGQAMYSVNAAATVRLIRTDTAQVLGSELAEVKATAGSPSQAIRKASGDAAAEALEKSIGRIARHWLEEVDSRGGQEIDVVMHHFSFARTATLVEKLRQVPGVKDVIVASTDPQAIGQLRIITNSSAADVGMVLTKLDSGLQIVSTSTNQIDVK